MKLNKKQTPGTLQILNICVIFDYPRSWEECGHLLQDDKNATHLKLHHLLSFVWGRPESWADRPGERKRKPGEKGQEFYSLLDIFEKIRKRRPLHRTPSPVGRGESVAWTPAPTSHPRTGTNCTAVPKRPADGSSQLPGQPFPAWEMREGGWGGRWNVFWCWGQNAHV